MFGALPMPWIIGGALALSLATSGFSYLKGRSDANGNCQAAALRAELAAANRDRVAAEAAAAVAEAHSRTLNAEAAADQERIREYEQTLAGRDACFLSPDDVERLRRLGGPR